MKALILSDEVNQFHWTILKSVVLVLALLPLSQFFMDLWQATEGSSQIMVGFMAISMFSAFAIISFYSALNASVMHLEQETSVLEQRLVQIYRYMPMMSLTVMMSYLAAQI